VKKIIFTLGLICFGLLFTLIAHSSDRITLQPLVTEGQSFEEWIEVEATSINPMATYSSKTDSEQWTGWNKFWFTSAIGGQIADVASTQAALNRGCSEANPLYGKDPSTGIMLLIKVSILGVSYITTEYFLYDHPLQQDLRNWVYGTLTLIGFGAAGWNTSQNCN